MKYPRTFHLPFSPGCTSDDKRLENVNYLLGRPLVVTEKMDGSNVCMESDACFARSHSDAPSHPSFDMFKAVHATVKHRISKGIQVFGEWLYAKHSIHYTSLPNYFMIFGVREGDRWASWEEVEMWAAELEVETVPVLARLNTFEEFGDLELPSTSACGETREGFVIRWASGFKNEEFSRAVAKFVRANHVSTSDHWSHQKLERNLLRMT